jgi:hypothetical protein
MKKAELVLSVILLVFHVVLLVFHPVTNIPKAFTTLV